MEMQAAILQAAEGSFAALFDLRSVVWMAVTGRRCIDQAEKPFRRFPPLRRLRVLVPVLRADIDGRVARQLFAHREVAEFGGVVV